MTAPARSARDPERGFYLRSQARYYGRLGVEVGIFVAVDHLRRAGKLSADQEERYFAIDDWFEEHLLNPPFYDDGNSIGAVTWFKHPVPSEMLTRVYTLRAILDVHHVDHDVVWSHEPGKIVYEDEHQVGVIPRERHDPTPLAEGTVIGPTRAGSKRRFAMKRAAGG